MPKHNTKPSIANQWFVIPNTRKETQRTWKTVVPAIRWGFTLRDTLYVMSHSPFNVQIGNVDDDLNAEVSHISLRHWVSMGAIALLALLGFVLIVCYVLNLILPESHRWLSPDDLSTIKDVVISIIGGLLMSLAMKYTTSKWESRLLSKHWFDYSALPFGGALLYNIGSVRFENDSYQVFDFQNILW